MKNVRVTQECVASLLDESLPRNFLSISPDNALLPLLFALRELEVDNAPGCSFAVFAESPLLELPLVLAFAVAVLAT